MPFQNDILAGTSANQESYDAFYESWYEGDLYGWGLNTYTSGAVGDNTEINRSSPVHIGTADSDWVISNQLVSTGYTHASVMAFQSDGSLWHWGKGANGGDLGVSGLTQSSPVQTGTDNIPDGESATGWISKNADNKRVGMIVSKKNAHMAIRADGQLWGWGYNNYFGYGVLGIGNQITQLSAVRVAPEHLWARVTIGRAHTLAVRDDGSLWSWGYNAGGQLGTGNTTNRSSPVQIGTANDWYNVTSTDYNSIALKTDGTLWGWGQGVSGNHGLGEQIARSSPVQIGTDTDWVAEGMANGHDFQGAVKNGELYAWGINSTGQLGLNDKTMRTSPTKVGTLTNWKYVSSGSGTSAAVKTDGTLWTWGVGVGAQHGALGDGTTITRSSPAQVGSATDWLQIQCIGQVMHGIRTT